MTLSFVTIAAHEKRIKELETQVECLTRQRDIFESFYHKSSIKVISLERARRVAEEKIVAMQVALELGCQAAK